MADYELVIRRKAVQEAVVTVFDVVDEDAATKYFNDNYEAGFPDDDAFEVIDSNGWPEVIQVTRREIV
jgi:hypothetical protein